MLRRRYSVLPTIALLAMILVGTFCFAQEEGHYGGTLVIATAKDASGLDPGTTNDNASTMIYEQIFDCLIAFDKDFNIIPSIAESWDVNEDSTIWTFHLRSGVHFHDGTDLTAEDVAYTFDRILNKPELASQKRSQIVMINTITVLDALTVQFELSFPYAPFLGATGQGIVSKAAAEAAGAEFTRNPIGSGPFKFVEWVPDDHVTLVRNEDYWMKRPYLETVIFRPIPENTVAIMSLMTDEVNVIELVAGDMVPILQANPDIVVQQVEGMNYYWIGFRQYASPYTNVKFRQMVNSAIDMDGIIANVLLNGTGSRAYGVVPPGLWPRDLDFMKANAIQQDKELAKQLFAELIAEGVMTSETEVVFHVNQDAVRELIGEIIVSELQSIGVNAVLKISEWAAYLDAVIKTEEPCMYMLGTTPKIPDPDAVFSWLFSSGEDGSTHGSLILGLSEQPEINQLLLEARTTPDQSQREELYKEIQRWAITENAYHIPAFHLSVTMAHSTKVHGLVALPSQIWMLCTETANVWVDGN